MLHKLYQSILIPNRHLTSSDKKYTTPVIYQTLNPEWNYTIDLKLNASRCPRFIHLTVWDKDTYGRDYLGEINIPIGNLFMRNGGEAMGGQARHYDDPQNQDVWFGLNKRSEKQNVSGEVCLRFGFVEDEVRSDEECFGKKSPSSPQGFSRDAVDAASVGTNPRGTLGGLLLNVTIAGGQRSQSLEVPAYTTCINHRLSRHIATINATIDHGKCYLSGVTSDFGG
ncbi:hypothetical protein BC936DRAFT_140092 [Jimgerdemannia flammicorona]|uniref:C2 domain-containing protein n=1 Tax=Jimgerdemannia flammicorona TaxID=994334 RepID=A0A433B2P9_9FUNG|nr:hypothetical protein BC936DRAFT_140092 [Jimgerdemannia flammicorona]